MADEADMQASQEEATVDNTAESHTEEQSNDSDVSQETEKTDESGSEENKQAENKSPANQDTKIDSKPTTHQSRRSSKFMAKRIEKLANENANLKRERQQQESQDDWEEPAEEESKPDIASLIAQEVERRLHPVISESSKAADDGEISELFSGDKAQERSSLEPRIREMWKLDQYKDVAASDLYKIAKFDELSGSMDTVRQQAVEEYKKAVREAKDSSASGTSNNSNRTGSSGKNVADMTPEEFQQHNERVKAGVT